VRRAALSRHRPAPLWAALCCASTLSTDMALGAPPPNADQTMAPWYRSLHTKKGLSCCEEADCRHYPVAIDGSHYKILYEGEWVTVPDEAVDRERMDNPTGDYVACVIPRRRPTLVLCFFLRPDT
jgi:hypothetical protein